MSNGGGGWRRWHAIVRFLPMLALGIIFLIIGASYHVSQTSHGFLGLMFVLVGALLVIFAFFGMAFTRCPTCSRNVWIVCLQEPDMRRDRSDAFYRELTPGEEDA
jgi:sulfite exporter TauE/SafE